jgi:hypothetical protein
MLWTEASRTDETDDIDTGENAGYPERSPDRISRVEP